MTEEDRKLLQTLCQMTEIKLRRFLIKTLKKFNYQPVVKTQYIFAEGSLPICLIAHMDTVFKYPPEEFLYDPKKGILWGVGGSGFDDRAGIFAILKLLQRGYRPSIIFTTDEERGCIGSQAFIQDYPECPFKDCRALVQLDRANRDDCVFYKCDNPEFENYIVSFGFEFAFGTFTDISWLGPAWKIAAVNLSVGYLDEHTTQERIHLNWLEETINKTAQILKVAPEMQKYIYIEEKISPINYYYYNIFPTTADDNDDMLSIERCYFCGRQFDNKKIIKHIIYNKKYNYSICAECKDLYDL